MLTFRYSDPGYIIFHSLTKYSISQELYAGHDFELFCCGLVLEALAHIFHFNDKIYPVPAM